MSLLHAPVGRRRSALVGYFEGRPDRRRGAKAVALVVGAYVVGVVLIMGGSAWAQRFSEVQWDVVMDAASGEQQRPWLFAFAMTTVGITAVAIAIALLRSLLASVAIVVSLAAGFGPLSLLAFPITSSPQDYGATSGRAFAWTYAVSTVLAVIIYASACVSTRILGAPSDPQNPPRNLPLIVAVAVAFVPAVLLFSIPNAAVDPGHEPSLSIFMMAGWGLLAGGLVIAGLLGCSSAAGTIARTIGAVAIPYVMYSAMNTGGGWPGAPGWGVAEDLPLFLTGAIAVVLVAAALIGLLCSALPRPWCRVSA